MTSKQLAYLTREQQQQNSMWRETRLCIIRSSSVSSKSCGGCSTIMSRSQIHFSSFIHGASDIKALNVSEITLIQTLP